MISVLYVNDQSIYHQLDVDAWNRKRDARNFTGDNVVICHPPCQQWSKMKAFAKHSPEEKQLALDAINHVRRNGGILEHPAGSSLWKVVKETETGIGFIISINQSWFGFPAQKRTWLYIVGADLEDLPPIPITQLGYFKPVHKMVRSSRSDTTMQLANWLIQIALIIEQKKSISKDLISNT